MFDSIYENKRFNFNENSIHELDLNSLVNLLNYHYVEVLDGVIKSHKENCNSENHIELSIFLTDLYFTYKEDLAKCFRKFYFSGISADEILKAYFSLSEDFKFKTNRLFDALYPLNKN